MREEAHKWKPVLCYSILWMLWGLSPGWLMLRILGEGTRKGRKYLRISLHHGNNVWELGFDSSLCFRSVISFLEHLPSIVMSISLLLSLFRCFSYSSLLFMLVSSLLLLSFSLSIFSTFTPFSSLFSSPPLFSLHSSRLSVYSFLFLPRSLRFSFSLFLFFFVITSSNYPHSSFFSFNSQQSDFAIYLTAHNNYYCYYY